MVSPSFDGEAPLFFFMAALLAALSAAIPEGFVGDEDLPGELELELEPFLFIMVRIFCPDTPPLLLLPPVPVKQILQKLPTDFLFPCLLRLIRILTLYFFNDCLANH